MHVWQGAFLVLDRPRHSCTPAKASGLVALTPYLLQQLALLHVEDSFDEIRPIHRVALTVHTVYHFWPFRIGGKRTKERYRTVGTVVENGLRNELSDCLTM